ncbi:unnamed protein product [Bursaphelenchus xylophilus]|uniref:glucuronosyltransferase n=1 Tax=Bursaphelenchus xylophilus TaxID=6326 RepID=A0A7I8XMY8_BURXY|nr:unnamed protein product [Bursaphelenchus xylophilus]CAG9125077.1 unnamed protein product [Bursaphelenchus xylophilus]
MIFNSKVASALAEDGHNVTLMEVFYDEPPGSFNYKSNNFNLWKVNFDWPNRTAPISTSRTANDYLPIFIFDLLKPLFYFSIFFESADIHSRLADACKCFVEKEGLIKEIKENNYDVLVGEQLTLCGFGIAEAAGIKTKIWMSRQV